MAVHERIYARIPDPPRKRNTLPALAIARYGSRYARTGTLARSAYYVAFVPTVFWCLMIYIFDRNETAAFRLLSSMGVSGVSSFSEMSADQWSQLQGACAWTMLVTQSWFALLLTPMIGARQVADDMRSRAFEVYLSRPIGSWDYFLGKLLIVARPVFFVLAGPPLMAVAVGHMLLEGSFTATWSIYFRIAGVSAVWALVNASVILGISSTGRSARYASIIWFALTVGSMGLTGVLLANTQRSSFDLLSYNNNLLILLKQVADFQPTGDLGVPMLDPDRSPWPSLAIVGALAALGCFLVLRRVRAGRLP